jgi:hypothetical protein
MKFNPANNIQDLQYFGEFGGVNPSISDSSTYTFISAKTMFDTFEGNADGCYLYARHTTPSNLYLGEALAVQLRLFYYNWWALESTLFLVEPYMEEPTPS